MMNGDEEFECRRAQIVMGSSEEIIVNLGRYKEEV